MKKLYLLLLFLAVSTGGFAQKCGTMNHWEKAQAQDPNTETRKQQLEEYTRSWIQNKTTGGGIITIPVVVHVVYNTSEENISDDQIQSQIDVLNEDFRLMNDDSLDDSHPFWQYTIDSQIEFSARP